MTRKNDDISDIDFEETGNMVIAGSFEDVSEEEAVRDDIDREINAVLSDMGADTGNDKIFTSVFRVEKGTGKEQLCFRHNPVEGSLQDRIREEYGPGDYALRLYVNGKIRKRGSISIAQPIQKKPEIPQGGDMAEMMRAMMEQQERTISAVLSEVKSAQQPQPDQMAQMTQMLTMMGMMKEVLGGNQQPQQSNDIMGVITTMKAMKELQEELGGDSPKDKEASLLDVARETLPELAKVVGSAMENRPAPAPMQYQHRPAIALTPEQQRQKMQQATMHQQRPQPRPQQPISNNQNEGDNMDFSKKIAQVHMLTKLGASPEKAANMILDSVPEDQYDFVVDFIAAPDAVDNLIKLYPPVAEKREWWEAVGKAIMAQFDDGDETEAVLTPTAGDVITPVNETMPGTTDADTSKADNDS